MAATSMTEAKARARLGEMGFGFTTNRLNKNYNHLQ